MTAKEMERELWTHVTAINDAVKKKLETLSNDMTSETFKMFKDEDFARVVNTLEEAGQQVTALGRTTSIFQHTLEDATIGRHGIGVLVRGIRSMYNDCISQFLLCVAEAKLKTRFGKIHSDFDKRTNLDSIDKIYNAKEDFSLPKELRLRISFLDPTPGSGGEPTFSAADEEEKPNLSSDLSKLLPQIMESLVQSNRLLSEKLTETLSNKELGLIPMQKILENQNEMVFSQNIDRWKLPPEQKFDSSKPKTLVLFLRHVTDRIMVDIKQPCTRWAAIVQNLYGNLRELANSFQISSRSYDEAISLLLNHMIEQFGDRMHLSNSMVADFLEGCTFDVNDRNQIITFSTRMSVFLKDMAYIGCSAAIDNIYFLQNVLDRLPFNVRQKWSVYVLKNDLFLSRIFAVDSNFKLVYRLPGKNEKEETIGCPNFGDEHEISFKFSLFQKWFEGHFRKSSAVFNVDTTTVRLNESGSKVDRLFDGKNEKTQFPEHKDFQNKQTRFSKQTKQTGLPDNSLDLKSKNAAISKEDVRRVNTNLTSFKSVLLNSSPCSFRPFARVIASDERGLHSKPIIVFFDGGSDGTFMTEDLRKDLLIHGKNAKLDIAGVNNEKPWDAKICNIVLRNAENPDICVTLSNIFSIEKKDGLVPRHTIPTAETVHATPGLNNLPWEDQPVASIMIGMDFPALMHNVPIEGDTLTTHVRASILGTVISGQLGSPEMIRESNLKRKQVALTYKRVAQVGCCSFTECKI